MGRRRGLEDGAVFLSSISPKRGAFTHDVFSCGCTQTRAEGFFPSWEGQLLPAADVGAPEGGAPLPKRLAAWLHRQAPLPTPHPHRALSVSQIAVAPASRPVFLVPALAVREFRRLRDYVSRVWREEEGRCVRAAVSCSPFPVGFAVRNGKREVNKKEPMTALCRSGRLALLMLWMNV